jgi:hypothetical protein
MYLWQQEQARMPPAPMPVGPHAMLPDASAWPGYAHEAGPAWNRRAPADEYRAYPSTASTSEKSDPEVSTRGVRRPSKVLNRKLGTQAAAGSATESTETVSEPGAEVAAVALHAFAKYTRLLGGEASEILPGLWQGGLTAAGDEAFFERHAIKATLSVGVSGAQKPGPSLHVADPGDSAFDDFLRDFPVAVNFIDQNRDNGMLVSCMTGATRVTPFTVAYLLATKLFPDAKSALAYVRRRRALTWMCWNPEFIKRLDEWAAHSGIVVAPRKGDWEFIQDALLAAQKEGSGPVRLKWDWWNEADSAVKLMNLIC